MPPFSFIHSADLHLDSPCSGIGEIPDNRAEVTELLRDATLHSYENLVDLCIERGVDFLLVAGDVYNVADRSLRAQIAFRNGLRRLGDHGIRTFVIHGNHDPLDGRIENLELPETAHVFGSIVESVDFLKEDEPVARIHGISYPKRDVGKRFGQGFKRSGPAPFQVGLLHCQVGTHPEHEPYAPKTVEELCEAGLDYWALGHVHTREIIREESPFIAYPGNTQGRHINESGAKGCLLVRVGTDGKIEGSPEFIPTDTLRFFDKALEVSSFGSIDELVQGLERLLEEVACQAEGRAAIVRVTLTGRSAIHRSLVRSASAGEILEMAREAGLQRDPFIWIEKIKIATRSEVDLDARRKEQDFLGDLLRLIDEKKGLPEFQDEFKQAAGDLFGHQRASRYLDELSAPEIQSILEEAEALCVDLLTDEEG